MKLKVAAIICEYNPFHNGHKYQIDTIKKDYDAVICIMSGSFVQRGDVAVYDKWTRAKAAVVSGCDLVIELPVCFSLNTAERFSFGSVSLAESLNIVDALCFGSECGDTDTLKKTCDILKNEPGEVSDKIKLLQSQGMNYPKAREIAFSSLIPSDILSKPNNILALEYMKALDSLNSKIEPVTIKRYISDYHETEALNEITSATSLRGLLNSGNDISKFIPKCSCEIYKNSKTSDINNLNNILLYLLRTKTPDEISQINDVTEGLENRLISSLSFCKTFDEIAEYVKTKRYTLTRIRRILLSLILGLDKNIAKISPEYIRVLAMNTTGINLLSEIKKKSALPIITKTADFKNFNKSFEKDILSTDLHSLCTGSFITGTDYKTSPVIIK